MRQRDAWKVFRDGAVAAGNGPEFDGLTLAIQRTQSRLEAATDDGSKTALLKRKWTLVQRRQRLVNDGMDFVSADPAIGLEIVG